VFLSTRQAQQKIEEHEENLGSPKVAIEPQFQARIQKAVDLINQKNPQLLRDVTDIIGHLDSGPFGRFTSSNPHTIYVNIQKIENELKSRLAGQPDDVIQKELDNQIVKTIMHEATHQKEVSERGFSSESGPDAAEKQADEFLPPIELQAKMKRKADILKRVRQKEEESRPAKDDVYDLYLSGSFDASNNECPHLYEVTDPQHASRLFRQWLVDNGIGSENAPRAIVRKNGEPYLRISYNGKLWNLDNSPYVPVITASMTVLSYVRKKGDKWCVMSHKGKSLGCYDSKSAANKRLRQIEYFKHQ
jgi:hypothetical protein